MTDRQENEIRVRLLESTDFLQRQRLLKALWKLQQKRENDPPKDDRSTRAA